MSLDKFDCFKSIFCVICILITIGLSSWRVYQYSLDQDLTRVNFRRFHTHEESVYPSLTLCFFDPYLPEELEKYETTASEYTRFLQGQLFDDRLLNVSYGDVTLDFTKHLLGYDIWYSEKGCMWKKNRFKREEQKQPSRGTIRPIKQIRQQISYKTLDEINKNEFGWKAPYISYSDPIQKCFTIDIPFKRKKILRTFNVRIKTDVFQNKLRPSKFVSNVWEGTTDGFMVIFNYPQQVISGNVKGKKNWPMRKKNDSNSYVMEFNLQNLEVVHDRRKRRNQCKNFPFDQDSNELNNMVQMAGCLPQFININNTNLPSCQTKNQMTDAYDALKEYFANRDDYVEDVCCRHLAKVDHDYWEYDMAGDGLDYFNITINYLDSKYREVKEIKAFTIYSLFGNIGGYVGIFIGYAFFHIPGILLKLKNGIKKQSPTDNEEVPIEKQEFVEKC